MLATTKNSFNLETSRYNDVAIVLDLFNSHFFLYNSNIAYHKDFLFIDLASFFRLFVDNDSTITCFFKLAKFWSIWTFQMSHNLPLILHTQPSKNNCFCLCILAILLIITQNFLVPFTLHFWLSSRSFSIPPVVNALHGSSLNILVCELLPSITCQFTCLHKIVCDQSLIYFVICRPKESLTSPLLVRSLCPYVFWWFQIMSTCAWVIALSLIPYTYAKTTFIDMLNLKSYIQWHYNVSKELNALKTYVYASYIKIDSVVS